jgi:hypothetical protein
LNEAQKMAIPSRDTLTVLSCNSMKADILNEQELYGNAIGLCKASLDSFSVEKGNEIYYEFSYAYAKIGNVDSAEYYYRLFEPNNTFIYSKLILNECIAEAKEDYKASLKYNKSLNAYSDSITSADNAAQIRFIETKYDVERERREATIIATKYKVKMQLWALIAIIFAVAVTLLVIILQRRSIEMSRQKALIKSLQADKIRISDTLIGRLRGKNEEERRLAEAFDNRMKFIAGLVDPSYRYGNDDSILLEEYKKSMVAIKADKALLRDLRSVVDAKTGGLTSRLENNYPNLTGKEIDLLCLVYSELPTSLICFLLHFSSFESLATRKTQIRRKLGTDQRLEDFLKNQG